MIADENLEYRSATKDGMSEAAVYPSQGPPDVLATELIDSFLNGPRTLSNDRLSYLIVSQSETPVTGVSHHDLLICAAHFIGDGMALHQFANDFLNLLGSAKTDSELETDLHNECQLRWARSFDEVCPVMSCICMQLILNVGPRDS